MADLIVTFTIPDAKKALVVDALCSEGGYQATLPDGSANPVSKAQFARRVMIQLGIKDPMRRYESRIADAAKVFTDPSVE